MDVEVGGERDSNKYIVFCKSTLVELVKMIMFSNLYCSNEIYFAAVSQMPS